MAWFKNIGMNIRVKCDIERPDSKARKVALSQSPRLDFKSDLWRCFSFNSPKRVG
jgi:hypothetical protein